VEYLPLTADLRAATEQFAARIPQQDRGFFDGFLLYQVAVAGWTRATPARRIAAVENADSPAPEMVGVVTIVPGNGWQSHVGEMRVVVQPSHRGQGVGRQLIHEGLQLADSLDLLKVSTELMASNAGGLALFESIGFRREAQLEDHVRDGEGNLQDLIILGRDVSQDVSQHETT
jgi:ribosomal protein S18 acetylase RimI-like enzyme